MPGLSAVPADVPMIGSGRFTCEQILSMVVEGAMSHETAREYLIREEDDEPERMMKPPEEGKTLLVNKTMYSLMEKGDTHGRRLFVHAAHKARIQRLWGGVTIKDFDKYFDFNTKIGSVYPTSYQTMMHWMNMTDGSLREQAEKLEDNRALHDIFNLLQSCIRSFSDAEEHVWYTARA